MDGPENVAAAATTAPTPAAPPIASPAPSVPVPVVSAPAPEPIVPAPPKIVAAETPSGGFPLPTSSGSVAPPPAAGPEAPTPPIPAPPVISMSPPSQIIPLPPFKSAAEPAQGAVEKRAKRDEPSKVIPLRRPPQETVVPPPVAEESAEASAELGDELRVDPEEFAQATEDFMRTSPVLGATGRRVKRGSYDDRGDRRPEPAEATAYNDPDAIAIGGMLDELEDLGIPKARQKEARARLMDLAKRIESGELDWTALRKAVWFAMEYPDVARRLMPLLLPWIDRAA
jgi:hypothetical protein